MRARQADIPSVAYAGLMARAHIALINDDTAFLDLMRDLLVADEGYEVSICKEWDGAYEFVKRAQPDLVIQDITIGGEEKGWTILNLLTLDPATRPIPVIVCSAAVQSLNEHQPMLDRFGITALPKPFDVNELLSTIERVIGEGPARQS